MIKGTEHTSKNKNDNRIINEPQTPLKNPAGEAQNNSLALFVGAGLLASESHQQLTQHLHASLQGTPGWLSLLGPLSFGLLGLIVTNEGEELLLNLSINCENGPSLSSRSGGRSSPNLERMER
jgi:hypothetical protein